MDPGYSSVIFGYFQAYGRLRTAANTREWREQRQMGQRVVFGGRGKGNVMVSLSKGKDIVQKST